MKLQLWNTQHNRHGTSREIGDLRIQDVFDKGFFTIIMMTPERLECLDVNGFEIREVVEQK